MEKLFLCFVLSGYITACSNSYNNPSLGNVTYSDLRVKPAAAMRSDSLSNDKDVTSLIPEGWHLLVHNKPVKVEGDLNKDGIKDIAMVIEKTQKSIDAPRSLLIAFGTKDDTFSLSIIASHVVLSASEGGGYGDPFDGLSIDRGSVIVSDFGGSSERWYDKYRFRFQDNDWYLIGATAGTNFPINDAMDMGNNEDDYNLLTGDFISTRTNKNGEVKVTKGKKEKKKLIKLKEFDTNKIGFSLY